MKTVHVLLNKSEICRNKNRQVQLRDKSCSSLIFRYSKNGQALGTFHVRYSRNGVTTSTAIGTYPVIGIREARQYASMLLLSIEADRFAANKLRKFESVGQLLLWYLEFRFSDPDITLATKRNIGHQVQRLLMPALDGLKVEDINAKSLAEDWIIPNLRNYKLSSIKGAFQCLKASFKKASRLGYISSSEILNINFHELAAGKVLPARSKIEAWQLNRLLAVLSKFPKDLWIFCILCLGYLTRSKETSLARWEHFDFDTMQWFIPSANTKTGQAISHPITPFINDELQKYKKWQRRKIRSQFLFPQVSGYKPITPSQVAHKVAALTGRKLKIHDLRKYGSSFLRDMGVDYYIVERILNHKKSALDTTYIHSTTKNVISGCLNNWHQKIASTL